MPFNNKPDELNPAQKVLLETYAGGDYVGSTEKDIEGVGDTLLLFLFRELATSEDCNSIDEARNRIGTVIRQLDELDSALAKQDFDEKEESDAQVASSESAPAPKKKPSGPSM